MAYQIENQRVVASEILQAIASGEDVRLDRCTVTGPLDVNRLFVKEENFDTSALSVTETDDTSTVELVSLLSFDGCTFEDNVCFAPPWDRASKLKVHFKRDIMFNSSVFCSQARFSKAIFTGIAAFDGCSFNAISTFRDAVFCERALFRTVTFNGYGLFDGCSFAKEARFTNACFARGGNFTKVRFGSRTDFSGVHSTSKSVPVYESVKFVKRLHGVDETFWQFIKQASQEAGYYQLAGEAFYNERCANLCKRFFGTNYDTLSLPKKIARLATGARLLPELVFGRLLFGYGERPIRILVASVIIILLCAILYILPGSGIVCRDMNWDKPGLMDGLYFSITTFTTLGFGDIYPNPDYLPARALAMLEALSGACLMALFVVSLAKRYSRG
jgi:uncharacterized protein YjbI with pentapeptide repeats